MFELAERAKKLCDYNHHRPHSILGYLPLAKFAARCHERAGGIAPPDQPITIQSTESEPSYC